MLVLNQVKYITCPLSKAKTLKKNEIFMKMIFNTQLKEPLSKILFTTTGRADRLLCLWVSKKEEAAKLRGRFVCLVGEELV